MYIQDATSVLKEVRHLNFISIPRKRSSRRKLIKTRPDLSKNRKVKLYSIAQSWLRSLLHRACCLRQPGHVTTYLQTQPVHTVASTVVRLACVSSIFAYTLSLKIIGAFSIARQFYTIFYRFCMACNFKREETRLFLLFWKRSTGVSSVALRS